jgi:hypothetical protein
MKNYVKQISNNKISLTPTPCPTPIPMTPISHASASSSSSIINPLTSCKLNDQIFLSPSKATITGFINTQVKQKRSTLNFSLNDNIVNEVNKNTTFFVNLIKIKMFYLFL